MNEALTGPTARSMTLDPKRLSQRELPPGNWAQMFLLYQSFCLANGSPAASKSVFYKSTKLWRRALKFRPFSKHSICETCDLLKSKMRHSTCFMSHAAAADQLLGHLRMTWECRNTYWQARQQSIAKNDMLTIILTGMTRASLSSLAGLTAGSPSIQCLRESTEPTSGFPPLLLTAMAAWFSLLKRATVLAESTPGNACCTLSSCAGKMIAARGAPVLAHCGVNMTTL